jgi:hypothetical protein
VRFFPGYESFGADREELGADIALLDFRQDASDRGKIVIDVQHHQAVMDRRGAHQQVDGSRTAVLTLLGELVLGG